MNDVRNMNLSSEEIDFDIRKTIYFARKELALMIYQFSAGEIEF